jgi:hypothetical protein
MSCISAPGLQRVSNVLYTFVSVASDRLINGGHLECSLRASVGARPKMLQLILLHLLGLNDSFLTYSRLDHFLLLAK